MCTFTFLYVDGNTVKCEHIKNVTYILSGNNVKVTERELLSHMFRCQASKTMWLFAEDESFCISQDNVRSITVQAE